MKVSLAKKMLAVFLAVVSVFNLTPFTMDQVTDWLLSTGFSETTAEKKADMILDIYVNQELIFLSSGTEKMARTFIKEYLLQIFSGAGNGQAAMDALAELPVYSPDAIDFTHAETYQTDAAQLKRAKKAIYRLIKSSGLPEDKIDGLLKLCNGINDTNVYFLTTEYEGVYQFAGSYVDDDGVVQCGKTGMYYDTQTGTIYNCERKGIFKIGFDANVKQLSISNPVDPWQRLFGFNILFDGLGNLLLTNINTVRVKFEYNGQKKMFQFWKGNYTRISSGGEVGMYNKKAGNPFQYTCFTDDELLNMSLKLYYKDELIYEKGPEMHWWITGYVPGPLIDKDDIVLENTIEFKEEGMRNAYVEAAKKAFKNDAVITVDDMTVKVVWQ